MAKRRMFSIDIVESDAFLDMPLSTQTLYFHLGMKADDDGFVSSPRSIQRMIGASDDDLKLLVSKRFILSFDNGVVVIKHWKINNLVRKDRYVETKYLDEKKTLYVKDNGAYTEHGIPTVNQRLTQYSIGKVRLGYKTHTHYISLGEFENVNLNEIEKEKLIGLYGQQVIDEYIDRLSINKSKTGKEYESDYAVLMEWLRKDNVSYL